MKVIANILKKISKEPAPGTRSLKNSSRLGNIRIMRTRAIKEPVITDCRSIFFITRSSYSLFNSSTCCISTSSFSNNLKIFQQSSSTNAVLSLNTSFILPKTFLSLTCSQPFGNKNKKHQMVFFIFIIYGMKHSNGSEHDEALLVHV